MPRRGDFEFSDSEKSRIRELKAKGYNAAGIKVQIRLQREQNYKDQVAQVNELYRQKIASGMNPAQAATSQFTPVPTNYIVTDTDTPETIAQRFNTSVPDLLDANPEAPNFQTGMVINTPLRTTSNQVFPWWLLGIGSYYRNDPNDRISQEQKREWNRKQDARFLNSFTFGLFGDQ